MDNLKRLGSTLTLMVVLAVTTFGGETNTPPCAPGEMSTPPCSSQLATDDFGEILTPPDSSAVDPLSMADLALSMLWLF